MKKIIVMVSFCLLYTTSVLANGALAIDGNQGSSYGFSYNQPSIGAAQNRALNECGGGCSIVQTFSNGCAAYAADQAYGSTVYGWGTGNSSGQAKSNAMQYCQNYGGTQCIVRVWGCNSN